MFSLLLVLDYIKISSYEDEDDAPPAKRVSSAISVVYFEDEVMCGCSVAMELAAGATAATG